ncbi:alpha/beta fold hydrolase [Litorisediminicola beolgyonensis]|uniref:Alpha/beta fold hydrolase n=1 Tax=Litorisediminicola beolgyonensis TaxID=1173614 RepID=A0ABW3ZL40_9RHOB
MLNTISHGTPGDGPPLILVHGLYGQARNWLQIARALSKERHVIAVDQRNHGDSPWTDSHDYPGMAEDLAQVIDAQGGLADLVGHSMGGKAVMALALTRPDLVHRMIIADMAPVAYDHDQLQYVKAMKSVDLSQVEKRSDAARQLSEHVSDSTLQSFFTQSIDTSEKRWKLNLDVLERDMDKVLGWPDLDGSFEGPALFLSGAESDYVAPAYRDTIRGYFPKARFVSLPGTGHWLHAEKPREFAETVQTFLDRS